MVAWKGEGSAQLPFKQAQRHGEELHSVLQVWAPAVRRQMCDNGG